jgi:hypothetical protein
VGLAGRLAAVAAAWALVAALASGAAAAPSSAIVRSVDVGSGAAESWLFLPEHAPECIVIVLHDRGDITPVRYDGLLAYLGIAKECAAVFPRYQATAAAPTAAAALRGLHAALGTAFSYLRGDEAGIGGADAVNALPVTIAGFGYGGTLAFSAAGNAKAWGLPVPGAVDSIFPSGGAASGLPFGPLDTRTHVLIQVGDQDHTDNNATGRYLWKALASHPAARKHYQLVKSHGALRAVHSAPFQTTAASETAFWLPLDTLIDAAAGY